MSTLPRIAADGRGARIGLIAVLALGQACAAAWAAVAVRAVFAALHAADGAVPWAALGGIAGAGIAITLLKVLERTQAERVGQEVEALYLNGPAAGGGVTQSVREVVAVASTLIPLEAVQTRVEVLEWAA